MLAESVHIDHNYLHISISWICISSPPPPPNLSLALFSPQEFFFISFLCSSLSNSSHFLSIQTYLYMQKVINRYMFLNFCILICNILLEFKVSSRIKQKLSYIIP
jgi:hypothetical protein